jgi:hypothetical protein
MPKRSHGMWNTGTYRSWQAMICRVTRPDLHPAYAHVQIDPRWLAFEAFYLDMGERPEGCQIDRIKGSEGYFKGNCRWATRAHNSQNRKLFSNNTTGRNGVQWSKQRQRWQVIAIVGGKPKQLYWGNDFFEACCVRAAFEVSTNYGGLK